MFFSRAFYFCQKMEESCVQLAGFTAHEEAMVLRVANVILRLLLQQAAVRNDGGFLQKSLSARRSVLVENERKSQKASWLGVKDVHEENRVDMHHRSLVACKRVFSVNTL